jgi:hypothetical protein
MIKAFFFRSLKISFRISSSQSQSQESRASSSIESETSSLILLKRIRRNDVNDQVINLYVAQMITKHTYLQSIDDSSHDQCLSHDQCFMNRQYRRELFNNRDNDENDRFSFYSRFRNKFSIRASKTCFVCDKFVCWSTNHIEKKREKSKKRFINCNSAYKERSEFELRFEQFIVDYKNIDINEFIA